MVEKRAEPLPQIGLKKKDGKFDYYLEHEILNIERKNYNIKEKASLRAVMLSDEEAEQWFDKIGIEFKKEGNFFPIEKKEYLLEIQGTIDKTITRAIAKIAFEYFAYHNKDRVELTDSQFDFIRNYVQDGKGSRLLIIDDKPILVNEKNSSSRQMVHILTLSKNLAGYIISQVSLSNIFRYRVLICPKESKLIKEMKYGVGHYFDTANNTMGKLTKTQIVIPDKRIIITKIFIPNY